VTLNNFLHGDVFNDDDVSDDDFNDDDVNDDDANDDDMMPMMLSILFLCMALYICCCSIYPFFIDLLC
jgi:hypothetical protein